MRGPRLAGLALAAVVLSAGAATAAPRHAAADTTLAADFTRGPGTDLEITVTNKGPIAARSVDNEGNVSGAFSLGLDTWSSGSTYMVAGGVSAPKPWSCSAQYDVIYCSKGGAFAPGESVTVATATSLCYPAGHAYQLYYFTNQGGNVGNGSSGAFAGAGGDCSTTTIGSFKLTVSNTLRERSAALKVQVQALDRQKQEVEDDLDARRGAVARAESALAAAEAKLPPIEAAIEKTRSFLAQIGTAEGTLTPAQRAELQARDSLSSTVADLQAQAVAAAGSGKDALAATLRARLAREQSRLDALTRSLGASGAPLDALRERWLERLRVLQSQLFAAQTARAVADTTRVQAAGVLQDALATRAALDASLLDVAKQIFAIDLRVGEVSVQAGYTQPGETVWKATALGSALDLDRIDQDLGALQRAKDGLAASDASARAVFVAAEQASIQALQDVTATIMSTAYKKAAVDFVANVLDVVKAGSKGGLIGASAETLKKAAEVLTKEYLVERGKGRWGSKGAVEFDGDLYRNITGVALAKAGGKALVERVVKETVTKKGKDALNKRLGTLVFEKVYGSVPELYRQAADRLVAAGNPSVELIQELQAAADGRAKQFASLSGVSSSTRWAKLGDLGTTLLKDVAKTTLNAHFDAQEQQAWIAYYEAEITAQMAFALWQSTATAYWTAYDAYQEQLERKARTLEGFDPVGHHKVALSKPFLANAPLTVLAGISSADSSLPSTVDVLVGGRKATPIGGVYVVTDPHFAVTAKGLPLEIRVR